MANTAHDTTGYAYEFACSICGRRRLFPDEMVQSDDGLFRCTVGNGCDERTAYNVDRARAAFRPTPDMVPPKGGVLTVGDIRSVEEQFIDRAFTRARSLLGWASPGVAYVDTCEVSLYRAGSMWNQRLSSATIQPVSGTSTNGVLALSSGTSGATAAQMRASGSPLVAPLLGNGYMALDIACTSAKGTNSLLFGVVSSIGFPLLLGYTSANANFLLSASGTALSTVAVDTARHSIEAWWTGAVVYFAVDGETPQSLPISTSPGTTSVRPFAQLSRSSGEVTANLYTALWLGE